MIREVEGGDREIDRRTEFSKDEIQLVAGFVGRRRRREVKVKGGEEGKKRFQFLSLDVKVAEKDECRVSNRDVGD